MNITAGIRIEAPPERSAAIDRLLTLFQRDLERCLGQARRPNGQVLEIQIREGEAESWELQLEGGQRARLLASDALGVAYGLFSISRHGFGVEPWGPWLEIDPPQRKELNLAELPSRSTAPAVAYRGWFINDEILLRSWTSTQTDEQAAWHLACETLLRLGGNLIIPGTSTLAPLNWDLAHSYGLMVTHHHHEPLGADLVLQPYKPFPDSFRFEEHQEALEEAWMDAIARQKGTSTLYALGFRGQGDYPFWQDDPSYKTDEERGAYISKQIALQWDMIQQQDPGARCCTNLYGEMPRLYRKGLIELPDECVRIWADNGYGAQKSRQQEGEDEGGESALPEAGDLAPHGVYTHVTFNDTRGANHLLPLTQDLDWQFREGDRIVEAQADACWIVNCGNIRPHILFLDAWARMWTHGKGQQADSFKAELAKRLCADLEEPLASAEALETCWTLYSDARQFWREQDSSATIGDQFHHKPLRWMLEHAAKGHEGAIPKLAWLSDGNKLTDQLQAYGQQLQKGITPWEQSVAKMESCCFSLNADAQARIRQLVLGAARIHLASHRGGTRVCQALLAESMQRYAGAWLAMYQAAQDFELQLKELSGIAGEERWKPFFNCDGQTGIRINAEIIKAYCGQLRLQHAGFKLNIDWVSAYDLHQEDHWLRKASCLCADEGELAKRLHRFLPDSEGAPTDFTPRR